jgi:hypothetical protein
MHFSILTYGLAAEVEHVIARDRCMHYQSRKEKKVKNCSLGRRGQRCGHNARSFATHELLLHFSMPATAVAGTARPV